MKIKCRMMALLLLWGGLFAAFQPVSAANLTKGPYLIYPGSGDQMTVLWQLDATTTCSLAWGTDATYAVGDVTSTEYSADHQHQYTITELAPGWPYYYRLQVGTESVTGSFRTPPVPRAQRLKFFAYGDTRSNPGDQNAVCGGIVSTFQADPAAQTFVLHVGDWVDPPNSESAWNTQYFDPNQPNIHAMLKGLPVLGCIGNHEGDGAALRKYWPYPYVTPDRFYWSFDYGPAHFTVIDQYDVGGPSDAQLAWVRGDLQRAVDRGLEWRFMVYHEPAYSAGGHPNNTRAQATLQPLAEQYGVPIIFCGHNHYYARCTKNGVQHLTVGGGGAPRFSPTVSPPPEGFVTANETLCYAKVAIEGNVLTCEAFKPDGTRIDSFTVTHLPAPVSAVDRQWQLFN